MCWYCRCMGDGIIFFVFQITTSHDCNLVIFSFSVNINLVLYGASVKKKKVKVARARVRHRWPWSCERCASSAVPLSFLYLFALLLLLPAAHCPGEEEPFLLPSQPDGSRFISSRPLYLCHRPDQQTPWREVVVNLFLIFPAF